MESIDDSKAKKGSTRGRGRGRGRRGKSTGTKRVNTKVKSPAKSDEVDVQEEQPVGSSLQSTEIEKTEDEMDFDSLSFVASSTSSVLPLRGNEDVWKNKVMLIGEKCPNPRIHLCDKCDEPILLYGRMIPCKHVFCFACGSSNEGNCFTCKDRVIRTEKNKLGSVYMCDVESCKRTYLSERDLSAHINHRHVIRKSSSNANVSANIPLSSPLQSSTIGTASHSRQMSFTANNKSANESFQSPIPVVSTRNNSNLRTIPIQNEMPIGNHPGMSMTNVGNQQAPMPHYSHQFRVNQMQWSNAYPLSYAPNGRVPNNPWPVNMQQSSHPSPFNRSYYP